MKLFSFIISVITFFAVLSLLIVDFPNFDEASSIIYFLMLFILMLMSVAGVLINISVFHRSNAQKRLKNNNKHMHA